MVIIQSFADSTTADLWEERNSKAARLAQLFKTTPQLWMHMQAVDLFLADARAEQTARTIQRGPQTHGRAAWVDILHANRVMCSPCRDSVIFGRNRCRPVPRAEYEGCEAHPA